MKAQSTFVEHLEELRRRLIYIAVSVVVSSAAVYSVIESVVAVLVKPVPSLVFLNLTEAFLVRINIALYLGLFLSFPVVIYNIWAYIRPALYSDERHHIGWFIPASYLLFSAGVCFCYFLVLPVGVKFLLSYETASIKPMISFSSYVSFVALLLLAFGVVFQLPLVQIVLVRLGLVSQEFMRKNRRAAVIVIFFSAAVLTPGPDIFSQFMMAVPMLLLYEAGIFLSGAGRAKQNQSGE